MKVRLDHIGIAVADAAAATAFYRERLGLEVAAVEPVGSQRGRAHSRQSMAPPTRAAEPCTGPATGCMAAYLSAEGLIT